MPVEEKAVNKMERFVLQAAAAADQHCYPELAQMWLAIAAKARDVEKGGEMDEGKPEDAIRQVRFACWDMRVSVDEYLSNHEALKKFIPEPLSRAVVLVCRLKLHERFDPRDIRHHRAMSNVINVLLRYRANRYGKGDISHSDVPCPKCEGSGTVNEVSCSACKGSGGARSN